MAYDEGLAQRVRERLEEREDVVEKHMFGGVAWMLAGNLACGVNKDALIVRVGPKAYDDALAQPHARVFDLTGRPMKGWVMIDAEGYQEDDQLEAWIEKGLGFASSLPAK